VLERRYVTFKSLERKIVLRVIAYDGAKHNHDTIRNRGQKVLPRAVRIAWVSRRPQIKGESRLALRCRFNAGAELIEFAERCRSLLHEVPFVFFVLFQDV